MKVNADGTKRIKLNIIIPATLDPGTYTIAMQLDAANAYDEANEDDNVVAAVTPLTIF